MTFCNIVREQHFQRFKIQWHYFRNFPNSSEWMGEFYAPPLAASDSDYIAFMVDNSVDKYWKKCLKVR